MIYFCHSIFESTCGLCSNRKICAFLTAKIARNRVPLAHCNAEASDAPTASTRASSVFDALRIGR